jgi:sugar transferase (PEP-CTERM/EpsH1 system associated)
VARTVPALARVINRTALKMKRKVVHLVYSLGFGGLEQVIVNLINNSTEYNVQHCIITLTGEHDLYDAIKPNVEIHNLDKKPGKDFSAHWKLYKLLCQLTPDVIHSYNFGTIEYHAIATLAGVEQRIHCEHGRGGDDPDGMNYWHNVIRKFSCLFIHKFIVVSPDLKQWGKDVLGLKEDKLKIIMNGVSLNEYYPSQDKHDQYTICTVGRANPVKNQKLLIEAFNILKKRGEEYAKLQLQIIGGGPIFDELKQQVKTLGLESQVTLLGYRTDVADIMRKADLFVLCSVYEAMPMTILEAMACELPVIATNVGGVSHMVSNNEAWIIESNNAEVLANTIATAYSDKPLAHKKAKQGKQLVGNNYSIERMVQAYMDLYDCGDGCDR